MNNKTITFGLTKAVMDQENKDYIDCFVPLVANLLFIKNIEEIDVSKVHPFVETFIEEYQIDIPFQPMQVILDRCRLKYNILSRCGSKLIVNKSEVFKYDLTTRKNEFFSKRQKFTENLSKYIELKYHGYEFDKNVDDVLLNFLEDNDRELLFFDHEKSFVKSETDIAISDRFILADYIVYSYEHCNEDFQYVIEVFIGHTISNTLLLSEVKFERLNFNTKKFYFDTPIILRALGYSEKCYKDTYVEFLNELYNCGSELYIFRHTLEEIKELLNSSLYWLDHRNSSTYDPLKASLTTQFLVQSNYSKIQLEVDIENIEDTIARDLKIEIIDKPQINDKSIKYLISEDHLTNIIEDKYKSKNRNYDVDLYKVRTQRDVDSISAIYLLREGKKHTSMKKIDHSFITTNTLLAYSNRKYNDDTQCSHEEILACLTDTFIGTLLWLNKPKLFQNSMSMKVLGQMSSTLLPDNKSESKLRYYAHELKDTNQITEDDFSLLMSSYLTKDYLSTRTLGDCSKLSSQTALEILEDIKNSVAVPLRDKILELEKDKSIREEEHFQTINQIEKTAAERNKELADKIKLISSNKDEAEEKLVKTKQTIKELIDKDIALYVKLAKIVLCVISVLVSCALYFLLYSNAMLYSIITFATGCILTFIFTESIIVSIFKEKVEKKYSDLMNI